MKAVVLDAFYIKFGRFMGRRVGQKERHARMGFDFMSEGCFYGRPSAVPGGAQSSMQIKKLVRLGPEFRPRGEINLFHVGRDRDAGPSLNSRPECLIRDGARCLPLPRLTGLLCRRKMQGGGCTDSLSGSHVALPSE